MNKYSINKSYYYKLFIKLIEQIDILKLIFNYPKTNVIYYCYFELKKSLV